MRFHFVVDFDGTVTLEDTTDVLLGQFADPFWLDVEAEWLSGRIGSRECLARQVALLRATPQQFDAVLAASAIDPDFVTFVNLARHSGATVEIVSDGFDRCILPILERAGVCLPVASNRLGSEGTDEWVAEFPASIGYCRSASGICKCRAANAGDRLFVLIGDGRSNFCLASRSDIVLAKGQLAAYCAEQNFPFEPMACFADVLEWYQPFLAKTKLRSAVYQ